MSALTGVPYKAHGGQWTSKGHTSVSPRTPYTVPAAPSGVATPSDDWQTAFADAFNPADTLTDRWYLNRAGYTANQDAPGFNTNEVACFNSSQVSVAAGTGLVLTAQCISNTQKFSNPSPPGSYRSGCVTTDSSKVTNGFGWKPTVGSIVAIEAVIKMPKLAGSDLGWWTDAFFNLTAGGSGGKQEIDLFEQFNFSAGGGGGEISVGAWFGTGLDGATFGAGREYYPKDNSGVDIAHDASLHRWTHVFDGNAQTVSIYLDGVLMPHLEDNYHGFTVGPGTFAWPTDWNPSAWELLMLSYALRDTNAGAGYSPPYVVGTSDTAVMKSVAVYVNGSATLSNVVQHPQIAPGTTVA